MFLSRAEPEGLHGAAMVHRSGSNVNQCLGARVGSLTLFFFFLVWPERLRVAASGGVRWFLAYFSGTFNE